MRKPAIYVPRSQWDCLYILGTTEPAFCTEVLRTVGVGDSDDTYQTLTIGEPAVGGHPWSFGDMQNWYADEQSACILALDESDLTV